MTWLELGTNKKVLSQGILRLNMNALSLTNQKIWPMQVFCGQTNRPTNRWATNYMPPISRCGGHKQRENAGDDHFLIVSQSFPKSLSSLALKSCHYAVKG